jgi:hypothetical protein
MVFAFQFNNGWEYLNQSFSGFFCKRKHTHHKAIALLLSEQSGATQHNN